MEIDTSLILDADSEKSRKKSVTNDDVSSPVRGPDGQEQVATHSESSSLPTTTDVTLDEEHEVPAAVATPKLVSKHNNESSVGNTSALTKHTIAVIKKKEAAAAAEERKDVKEYVISKLFRKVKFLAGDDMLNMYVRNMVETGLNVKTCEDDVDWWWNNYRGVVKHAISEKRSNITSDMRRRFGKGMYNKMDNGNTFLSYFLIMFLSCSIIPLIAWKNKLSGLINSEEDNSGGIIGITLPTISEILDLGTKNTGGAYGYAFLHIFPSTYGWVPHKAKVHMELQSKVFNATDEALALLILENNYDMWTSANHGRQCEPQYTVRFAREDYMHDTSDRMLRKTKAPGYGGWSFKGIKRFKELVTLVKIDRKTSQRKEMEKKFLKYMKSQGEDNAVKRKKTGVVISQDEEMMKSESMWNDLVADEEESDEENDMNEDYDEDDSEAKEDVVAV